MSLYIPANISISIVLSRQNSHFCLGMKSPLTQSFDENPPGNCAISCLSPQPRTLTAKIYSNPIPYQHYPLVSKTNRPDQTSDGQTPNTKASTSYHYPIRSRVGPDRLDLLRIGDLAPNKGTHIQCLVAPPTVTYISSFEVHLLLTWVDMVPLSVPASAPWG